MPKEGKYFQIKCLGMNLLCRKFSMELFFSSDENIVKLNVVNFFQVKINYDFLGKWASKGVKPNDQATISSD